MKTAGLLLCAALTSASASAAAAPQDPPDVAVLEHNWSTHVDRRDWDRDMYQTPAQADADERERVEKERHPNDRGRVLGPGELPPPPEYSRKQSLKGTKGFQYRAVVRNTGAKTIRSISWDYVFFDRSTGEEVGRHSFETRRRIKPGQRGELIEFSVSAPSKVVSAEALSGGDARRPHGESLIITRVEYADGSIWTRPRR